MVVAVGRRVHEICLKLARETRFVELGKACSVGSEYCTYVGKSNAGRAVDYRCIRAHGV